MIPNGRRGLAIRQDRLGSLWDDAWDIGGDIFGDQHPLDQSRMADARRFAAAAKAGDRASYLRLKCLSALGTANDAAEYMALTGGDCGTGWATQKARDYGAEQLRDVDAYLAQTGNDGGQPGAGPPPPGGGNGIPAAISQYGPAIAVAALLSLVVLPQIFKGPKGRRSRGR